MADGLDEVTTTGATLVFEISGPQVRCSNGRPPTSASRRLTSKHLRGGDRARNAEIATAVLEGQPGPQRDIVLVNSAAALMASGIADNPLDRHGTRRPIHRFRRSLGEASKARRVHRN